MKIKNGNMPAMPQCGATDTNDGQVYPSDQLGGEGLTKREMFAMHFMAAEANRAGCHDNPRGAAEKSVAWANALLTELDK